MQLFAACRLRGLDLRFLKMCKKAAHIRGRSLLARVNVQSIGQQERKTGNQESTKVAEDVEVFIIPHAKLRRRARPIRGRSIAQIIEHVRRKSRTPQGRESS